MIMSQVHSMVDSMRATQRCLDRHRQQGVSAVLARFSNRRTRIGTHMQRACDNTC